MYNARKYMNVLKNLKIYETELIVLAGNRNLIIFSSNYTRAWLIPIQV